MNYNNVAMKILIKGKPITEYTHRGLTYVEGREGSEYELELTNNNSTRVEVIVSVDGLSIIDGKPAGPESTGYLLNAYQKAIIPGWMVDQATAAKFKFGSKEKSYSTEMNGGSSINNGVIGMMIYSEKPKPIQYQFQQFYNGMGNTIHGNAMGNVGIYNVNICASGAAYASASTDSFIENLSDSKQELGTEFGEATDFKTTIVNFERHDMIGMFVIYYDSKKRLENRGIVVSRKQNIRQTPDAFPAMATGCVPPKNWKG
jgi:hypothetical protein